MKYYLKVLQNYATFTGRASRSEYWFFVLFNLIFSIIINVIGVSIGMEILGTIYSLVLLVPSIAVVVRRMHDTGKSGWYCLIPIYNLILALTAGDSGENEYGNDPQTEEEENGEEA
jgi:uncharacterized membrane protein YhaH (DUF805 family)